MNRAALLVAAALVAGLPGSALAQASKTAQPLTAEQRDHAIQYFGILSSALRSQNVPNDAKSALMACIYSNSLGEISNAVDKVIAANAGKIDRSKPEQLVGVMAAVCGYKPDTTAPSGPPAPPAKGTSPAPKGR